MGTWEPGGQVDLPHPKLVPPPTQVPSHPHWNYILSLSGGIPVCVGGKAEQNSGQLGACTHSSWSGLRLSLATVWVISSESFLDLSFPWSLSSTSTPLPSRRQACPLTVANPGLGNPIPFPPLHLRTPRGRGKVQEVKGCSLGFSQNVWAKEVRDREVPGSCLFPCRTVQTLDVGARVL